MKYLMWLLNAAIFILLFVFALKNQTTVVVHLLFGAQWQVQLVLALFMALLLGVGLGVLVMLPLWLRARKTSSQRPKVKILSPTEEATSAILEASTSASSTL